MTVGFSILALLTVAVGGFAYARVASIQADATAMTVDSIPGLTAIGGINGNVQRSRALVLQHILTEDPARLKKFDEEIAKLAEENSKLFDSYKASISVEEDRRLFAALEAQRARFRAGRDDVVLPLSRALKTREAQIAFDSVLEPVFTEYMAALDAVVDFNVNHARELSNAIATAVASTKLVVAGAMLAAVVLAVVLGWFIVSGTNRVLGTALGELGTGARQVVSAASQVATSAESLSQGATEQAASLEETSASMEEMSSMTRTNATSAKSAATLMSEVDVKMQASNAALGAMVTSMDEIRESSLKVSRIIKTIDEIAFQTNILALNAAVEAARAGEAGMGFAVVADEVRNLAQRSAQAAKDTTSLIEASVAKSQAGSVQVGEVVASIGEITERARKVKALVDDISGASQQQAQGIDQVAQAVTQMEKVTQSTAATAEESAAASEELNAQAESTLRVVEQLAMLVGGSATKGGDDERVRKPSVPARGGTSMPWRTAA